MLARAPLAIPAVRSEAGPLGQFLLYDAVDARRKVKLDVEPLVRARVLGRIFVEHDDDLRHVVQLGHEGNVLHGALPLIILVLLKDESWLQRYKPASTDKGLGAQETHVDEADLGNDGEERVDVALRGEIQPSPHCNNQKIVKNVPFSIACLLLLTVTTRRGNARRVPRVEAVDAVAFALLRLDIPLEVAPYLPQQRPADALRYGQFLRARHALDKKD